YIGESGLLITPELGPRVKISAIFTSISNLPIKEVNEHAWIPDYCEKCGKCIKACPEKALIEKETCCSTETEFLRKQCIGCSQGCTYCIEDCPFNKKGYEHVKNKFDKMNAKLKEKQDKKFSTELWDNWAKQNFSLFNSLVDDATIAISMAENNDRIILLQKENDGIKVSIKELKNLNELENLADLIFIIGEKEIGEILKDNSSAKFVDLLGSGKIGIYGLISQLKLIEKGYEVFLYQLGFNLGGGCCCG
ncbi:MAG: 4Fe-4S binding protein, partial [Methanobacterium sp.]